MKIKDERSGKRVVFAEVPIGEWFIPTEGGGFWMKTEIIRTAGASAECNAVSVHGRHGFFTLSHTVTLVETELVIKGNP